MRKYESTHKRNRKTQFFNDTVRNFSKSGDFCCVSPVFYRQGCLSRRFDHGCLSRGPSSVNRHLCFIRILREEEQITAARTKQHYLGLVINYKTALILLLIISGVFGLINQDYLIIIKRSWWNQQKKSWLINHDYLIIYREMEGVILPG